MITLTSSHISVRIDPLRGSDVLAIEHIGTGQDVLFTTPWRARAEMSSPGSRALTDGGSTAAWLESYRGGWQLLCPNAGPPREASGVVLGFHGEASMVEWILTAESQTEARLSVELTTVPFRVDRIVRVDGATVKITDSLFNDSAVEVPFDYVQHLAFGGALLQGPCTLSTNGRTFTSDPELGTGDSHPWPEGETTDGICVDLTTIDPRVARPSMFGWLADFDDPAFASLVNTATGLGVQLEWDPDELPYAWLWQELQSSPGWPWFARARVIAIEPASTITGGPDRIETLSLQPGTTKTITTALTITQEKRT